MSDPSKSSHDLAHFERLGHYRIVRKIAEGGMGAVYEAEQDNPRRTVALKVIRAGLTSEHLLRRFEHEAQILGRLHHAGIAQVFEAGTAQTSAGPQPYFVMELVDGLPLTEYAERHSLDLSARLALMSRICDAVQHAHQKGVIHRDLKPANILVEDNGQPKILDFGVARATDSDLRTATMQTDVGQLLGTLPYMSPEQVAADPLELDVRSDVYALGVVLYELVSGRAPYELSGKMIYEAARVIREVDPVPLSSVDRVFRGDVETIVGKALEKDKARRYGSAAELAADIDRYLRDEPIVARPASATYQLGKFARRNRALVAGVVAAFLVLVLGVVASTWQAVRATRAEGLARTRLVDVDRALGEVERQRAAAEDARGQEAAARARAEASEKEARDERAEAERQRAEAVTNFGLARSAVGTYLDQVTDSADLKAHGLERLRRQLLDTARGFYERFLEMHAHDDTLEAELAEACMRLGNIDRELGDHASAARLYLRARATYESLARAGYDSDRSAKQALVAAANLGLAYADSGRIEEAEAAYRQALELDRLLLAGEPDPFFEIVLANAYDHLGTLYDYSGRAREGEASHLQSLEIRERMRERDPKDVDVRSALVRGYNNLATLYAQTGRANEAAPYLEKSAELCEALVRDHGSDPVRRVELGVTLNNLGGVYTLLDRAEDARAAHERALAVREKLAREHPAVIAYRAHLAGSYTNLGELDCRDGNHARGLAWLDRASASFDGVLAERPDDATARYDQSYTASWRGRALALLGRDEEALAAWERALVLDDRADASLRVARADALARVGRHADAAAEVSKLAANADLTAEALCEMAGAMSRCVRAVAHDPELLRASDGYAARAIELLRRVAASGPRARSTLAAYWSDPVLGPLREHPEFTALGAEIGAR